MFSVQRGVVINRAFPGSVQVVGHQVDGVKEVGHLGHFVASVRLGSGSRDSSGQLPSLGIKSCPQFPDKSSEARLVASDTANVSPKLSPMIR